jgi:hypothetical protein
MHKTPLRIALLAAGLFACSSGGSSGGFNGGDNGASSGGEGTSSSSGTGSSGGVNSSGSSGGSSGGSGSSSGAGSSSGSGSSSSGVVVLGGSDAGASDGGNLDQPITLTLTPFVVQPNTEVYKCQQFANPFGQDVDLVKLDGTMTQGSHHFFLFNMSPGTGRNTASPLGDCPGAGLEFHPFPYLSQQPHWVVEYGAGMGYPLMAQNGLMMNVHYLNTSAQPVTANVSITIYPAKPGTVTTHVGNIFLDNISISVPPGVTQSNPMAITASNTPIVDEDYTIFTNWSHMHQYSTKFTATTGGSASPFYTETAWAEPPLITGGTGPNTSPTLPMQVKSGTSISWTCSYYNPTSATMTFGDSAQTSDMCIYMGMYYPADGTPSTNANYPDIINNQAGF